MTEREKVIRGLECCKKDNCFECPYNDTSAPIGKFGTDELVACQPVLYADALSLLKAQEPKFVSAIAEAIIGCKPKVKVGHCPSCGVLMSETDRYCRKCGQAVKWE